MADQVYFYLLRIEARRRVQNALNARILRENDGSLPKFDRLTLCSIESPDTPDALKFAREVWPRYHDKQWSGFPMSWDDIVVPARADPDMFDLAIWQEVDGEQVLAALAFGTPSNRRTHLTLKWVERFKGHTHIAGKVLFVTLACAEEYAKLLGCERVLVKDPLVPKLYEMYGYGAFHHPQVAYGGSYMSKELVHG